MLDKRTKKMIKKVWNKSKSKSNKVKDSYDYKMDIANIIKIYTEDNRIAFVCGGVDCDGGMWENRVRIISNPSITKLINIEENYYCYAEGHQWHRYMTVEDAEKLRETSRDLAMESYENGHSHTIRI